jgi:hypothetical protein
MLHSYLQLHLVCKTETKCVKRIMDLFSLCVDGASLAFVVSIYSFGDSKVAYISYIFEPVLTYLLYCDYRELLAATSVFFRTRSTHLSNFLKKLPIF